MIWCWDIFTLFLLLLIWMIASSVLTRVLWILDFITCTQCSWNARTSLVYDRWRNWEVKGNKNTESITCFLSHSLIMSLLGKAHKKLPSPRHKDKQWGYMKICTMACSKSYRTIGWFDFIRIKSESQSDNGLWKYLTLSANICLIHHKVRGFDHRKRYLCTVDHGFFREESWCLLYCALHIEGEKF
jgi:hypothetical protein